MLVQLSSLCSAMEVWSRWPLPNSMWGQAGQHSVSNFILDLFGQCDWRPKTFWLWTAHRVVFYWLCCLCGWHYVAIMQLSGNPTFGWHICMDYGKKWDICFNSGKTHCITLGGDNPETFNVILNQNKLEWCSVIKYLGCYFQVNSCYVDIRQQIRKYYVDLNILSVLGKGRNVMAAVHLIQCYCVPSLAYACKYGRWQQLNVTRVNVLWNNTFRQIFNSCWRESTSGWQFYCNCLPRILSLINMPYVIL